MIVPHAGINSCWKPLCKLAAGLALALLFIFCTRDSSLSPNGLAILGTLIFITVVWTTGAVSYPVSAFLLIAAMTLFTAFVPDAAGVFTGTGKGLEMAVSGFRSQAWILVLAALILSSAIQQSGLGQRTGLFILSHLGTGPRQIRLAMLLMCFLLALFIPAQAANAALMTSICLGLVDAFKVNRKSRFAKGLFLYVAFGTSLAGMAFLTSGPPSIQTAEFISQKFHHSVTWLEWMKYSLPFSIALCTILFFLIEILFPVSKETIVIDRNIIHNAIIQNGKISAKEIKLLFIIACTILLWSTKTLLHEIDNSTVAILAVSLIFIPGTGDLKWGDVSKTINWGTLLLFGASLSLGQQLLDTGAAAWVAQMTLIRMGVSQYPSWGILAAGTIFFGFFSLFFSSRSAAVATIVPTIIAFSQAAGAQTGLSAWGMTIVLFYSIQFTLFLPVNSPMSMLAFTTNTFTSKDMIKTGTCLFAAALLLIEIFSCTYWQWIDLL